jgi:hypothetical protein
MTAATHTPGPWLVTTNQQAIKSLNGSTIAQLVSPHVNDANARLIAAAPELLAALKEAAVYIQSFRDTEADIALTKAMSAIAKAEARVS